MPRRTAARMTAIVCILGLAAPAWVGAGDDGFSLYRKHQCEPSMYSRWNYWAPNVYRLRAFCAPRGPYICPGNTTPGIDPQARFLNFKCPAVNPATLPYGDLAIQYAPGQAGAAPRADQVPPASLTPDAQQSNPGAVVPGR